MSDTQWLAVIVFAGVALLVAWAWVMKRIDEREEREERAQRDRLKRGGPPALGGRPEPRHVRRARR